MPTRTSTARSLRFIAAAALVGALVVGLAPEASAVAVPSCKVKNNTTLVTISSPDGTALYVSLPAASPGDILFVRGTCTGNFLLTQNVSLIGQSSPIGTPTLSGGGSGTVVRVNDGVSVTLKNLTITNGVGPVGGNAGGVHAQPGSSVTLSGTTTVTGNNGGGFGGGVSNSNATVLLLNKASITNNTAPFGAGVFNSGVISIKANAHISGNTALVDGGGVYNYGGLVLLSQLARIDTNAASGGCGGGIRQDIGGATNGIPGVNVLSNTPTDIC